MKKIVIITLSLAVALTGMPAGAQQRLTLDECRQMAVSTSKDLDQAKTKVEMAGYDKKIARANYFPNISASGAYTYNSENISLISDEKSAIIRNMGTTLQNDLTQTLTDLATAVLSNKQATSEFFGSPLWQTVTAALSKKDISAAINGIGAELDDALHLDVKNVFIGAVTLQQPVFVGGKIIEANKVAKLAQELSKTQYEQKYQDVVTDVDQAYWQIVSIANKKKLADSYSDLLHHMQKDVETAVKEGVATESDMLQVKVKTNEADMLKTKAENGLKLSKMLLCKQIGIDLGSDIILADEELDAIPVPQASVNKDMEQIIADRAEMKSLDLAAKIYDGKAKMARADLLPKIALTGNYIISNPNFKNGYSKEFGGFFTAGVMVNVPLFHGFETQNKTRKAMAEARLYRSQYENAKDLITLQVTQLRQQQGEAFERLNMAQSNLENAEENLRTATIGFEEGVIEANTALAAHTAWLQAQSEYIEAGVELQMNSVNLEKAQGNYNK